MAVTGGAIGDIWPSPVARGVGLDVLVMTGYLGPALGPIIGTYITQSSLGWRWALWVTIIAAYGFSILFYCCVPETFAPVLLSQKAKKLRLRSKNWALHSKHDMQESITLSTFARTYLVRPMGKLTSYQNNLGEACLLTRDSPSGHRTYLSVDNHLHVCIICNCYIMSLALSTGFPKHH